MYGWWDTFLALRITTIVAILNVANSWKGPFYDFPGKDRRTLCHLQFIFLQLNEGKHLLVFIFYNIATMKLELGADYLNFRHLQAD